MQLIATIWILFLLGIIAKLMGFGELFFSVPKSFYPSYPPSHLFAASSLLPSISLITLAIFNAIFLFLALTVNSFRKTIMSKWFVYPWLILGIVLALAGLFPWFGDRTPSLKTQIIYYIIFFFPILTFLLSVPAIVLIHTGKKQFIIFSFFVYLLAVLVSIFYIYYSFNRLSEKISNRIKLVAKEQSMTLFKPSYLPDHLKNEAKYICTEGFSPPYEQIYNFYCVAKPNNTFKVLDIEQGKNYVLPKRVGNYIQKQITVSGSPATLSYNPPNVAGKPGGTIIQWEKNDTKIILFYELEWKLRPDQFSSDEQEKQAVLIAESMQEVQ